jgi:hypothetical protein
MLAKPGEQFLLPLDGGESVTVLSTGAHQTARVTVWHGEIVKIPGGIVTIVLRGEHFQGAIHAGARGDFAVEGDRARVVVRKLDRTTLTTCGHRGGPHAAPIGPLPAPAAQRAATRSFSASANCDDGSVIDAMVVYTTTARVAAGGVAQIEAAIELAIADANAAFARSAIDTTLRLVHSQEVSYAETGDWEIDGPRLVDPADGFLDEVHALRDQYGADCVSLWVEELNAGGIGYFPHPSLEGIGTSGFSMLRRSGAALLTFAHEIGHNLWCTHDRPNTADVPFAPYSYGYVEPGGAWQTIMAVSPTALIPYFANPEVNWPGPDPPNPGPTGLAEGAPNACDVAKTINQTRHIVANFRPTAVPDLPPVLHVRADAPLSGDGTSWASAFADLNEAMCAAAGSGGAVQEIWVKAGTYRPDRGTGDRAASFRLRDGLAIYGGFAGTEQSRDERDPEVHVTILSGDIGAAGVDADNSYHVVDASLAGATAVLDGFTITAGRADGVEPDDRGAGVIIHGGGSPTLRNCRITGNIAADRGGGMYVGFGSAPTLTGCWIGSNGVTNTDWPAGGGGIYNEVSAAPVLENCAIVDNSAARGAGMANFFDCAATLIDCHIADNVVPTGGEGGGIYSYDAGSLALIRCVLERNEAGYGGAMASYFGTVPTLVDCSVRDNTAFAEGGGLYNYASTPAALERCLLSGNSAEFGGAMCNLFDSVATLVNCRILDNAAAIEGGGLYNYSNASALLANCHLAGNSADYGGAMSNLLDSNAQIVNATIVGNTANVAGGGVLNYQSHPVLTNSILWQNRVGAAVDEVAQVDNFNATLTLANCTVSGWTGALGGVNNNGADPQFGDADGFDDVFGTDDDDARPLPGSPAHDTGDSSAVPPYVTEDLDGRSRFHGASVDRGAYEHPPAPGDFDFDGEVTLADYPALAECLAGPSAAPAPAAPITPPQCRDVFDFDGDDDVDLADAAALVLLFAPAGE